MANTKLGLDFGTHQTKVCVVDSSDKRNLRYLFFRFKDGDGIEHVTLPSVVQVNADDTLSYGYVDNTKAKLVTPANPADTLSEPLPPTLLEYAAFPEIPQPEKPQILDKKAVKDRNILHSFSDLLNAIIKKEEQGDKSLKQQQAEAKVEYAAAIERWKKQCEEREINIKNDRVHVDKTNAQLQQQYEQDLGEYKKKKAVLAKPSPLLYENFKQAVFSTGAGWKHNISAQLVSIWYLTYVFFQIDKKYGTQSLVVNMGTSSGVGDWESNKKKATEIMLTVYDLIERVFNHDMQRFLNATVEELKNVTQVIPYSRSAKEESAIFVFPEAVANLQPLAHRKAFSTGLNLLVDIGGGTVDISLFTAPLGDDVMVYDYQSLPMGLNHINRNGPIPHISSVSNLVRMLSSKIMQYAISIRVSSGEAKKIIRNRNVVFTGGGSIDDRLTIPYHGFSNVMRFKEKFNDLISFNIIEK